LKIDSAIPQPFGPLPPASRPDGAPAPAPAAGSDSSRVAFSAAARGLLAMQDGAADIDAERVAALREAIAAGRLSIDPGRIADGLIASARELLG